jgi:hypothetical protein
MKILFEKGIFGEIDKEGNIQELVDIPEELKAKISKEDLQLLQTILIHNVATMVSDDTFEISLCNEESETSSLNEKSIRYDLINSSSLFYHMYKANIDDSTLMILISIFTYLDAESIFHNGANKFPISFLIANDVIDFGLLEKVHNEIENKDLIPEFKQVFQTILNKAFYATDTLDNKCLESALCSNDFSTAIYAYNLLNKKIPKELHNSISDLLKVYHYAETGEDIETDNRRREESFCQVLINDDRNEDVSNPFDTSPIQAIFSKHHRKIFYSLGKAIPRRFFSSITDTYDAAYNPFIVYPYFEESFGEKIRLFVEPDKDFLEEIEIKYKSPELISNKGFIGAPVTPKITCQENLSRKEKEELARQQFSKENVHGAQYYLEKPFYVPGIGREYEGEFWEAINTGTENKSFVEFIISHNVAYGSVTIKVKEDEFAYDIEKDAYVFKKAFLVKNAVKVETKPIIDKIRESGIEDYEEIFDSFEDIENLTKIPEMVFSLLFSGFEADCFDKEKLTVTLPFAFLIMRSAYSDYGFYY